MAARPVQNRSVPDMTGCQASPVKEARDGHHLVASFAGLAEDQRQLAMARFAVLQPTLEHDVPLIRAATQANVPLRTVQRWLARYRRDGGLVGLARAGCRNAGNSCLPADLVTLIEGMALRRPRSSAAAIHRRATAIAEAQGWRIPSYSKVYAILARLDPAMVTLPLDGSAAFRDCYELSIATERSRSALWQRGWLKISLQKVAICLDAVSVLVCSFFVLFQRATQADYAPSSPARMLQNLDKSAMSRS